MRCPGPNRRNKYLAPDVNEVPITILSDLMAQIELSCHISHLSLMYSDGVVPGFGLTRNWFSLVDLWKDKASHR
jgi:hypothetical protein